MWIRVIQKANIQAGRPLPKFYKFRIKWRAVPAWYYLHMWKVNEGKVELFTLAGLRDHTAAGVLVEGRVSGVSLLD